MAEQIATDRAKIYLITPEVVDIDDFLPKLEAACATNKVAMVQVRTKQSQSKYTHNLLKNCIAVCSHYNVKVFANDSIEDAVNTGCDGVHLGQSDIKSLRFEKKSDGSLLLGITCHNDVSLAVKAIDMGANYVAFGSFFPSPTKPNARQCSLDVLRQFTQQFTTPCVAIGGINATNIASVIEAGAHYAAISSAVWQHKEGAVAAINELDKAINNV